MFAALTDTRGNREQKLHKAAMGFLFFKTMRLKTAFRRDNQALNPGNKPATNWHQALGSSGELLSLCFVTPLLPEYLL